MHFKVWAVSCLSVPVTSRGSMTRMFGPPAFSRVVEKSYNDGKLANYENKLCQVQKAERSPDFVSSSSERLLSDTIDVRSDLCLFLETS